MDCSLVLFTTVSSVPSGTRHIVSAYFLQQPVGWNYSTLLLVMKLLLRLERVWESMTAQVYIAIEW